jgi:acetate kinase
MSLILTLNTGSSSLKFGLYEAANEPVMLCVGQVDGIGADAQLVMQVDGVKVRRKVPAGTQVAALDCVIAALREQINGAVIAGIGHRIVHGGPDFAEPMVLNSIVLDQLAAFSPLAPLHQPHNLAGVIAAQRAFPGAIQVGCFDTAFHRGHPWVNDTFAIPRRFYDQGVRRYGFHGLSYDYITGVVEKMHPELHEGRVVIAHLGNGASMCAVHQGKSIGSTMGFSALDGLPMGTRCGQIDPGVLLYLIQQKGMDPHDVLRMLYQESGLLGLSGISSDMRTLLASDAPEAAQAIDYYVFRARREVGAMTTVLGGIDALVFCGGIGENAAPIRQRIIDGLGYLGLSVDAEANARNELEIGKGTARIMVVPTDEERIIARAVNRAISNHRKARRAS